MKTISCGVALSLFFVLASFASVNCSDKMKDTTLNGFAVVELFTSEGCSSCPPADAAVAKLLNDYKENVYVLGFHVDYWNYLGWKDNFSSAAYSARQQQYGRRFQLNSIYTPQVIVNGTTQFVGSNKAKLVSSIAENLKESVTTTIKLTADSNHKNINVAYKTNAASSNQLNIALVQLDAESKVLLGENAGKILRHVNVVRDFKTVDLKSANGNINITLPPASSSNNFIVIGFIQDKNSMKISAAAKTAIE